MKYLPLSYKYCIVFPWRESDERIAQVSTWESQRDDDVMT